MRGEKGASTASAAALLLCLALFPSPSFAQDALPPVELWLGLCGGVDAEGLRRLAALELGPGLGLPGQIRPRVTIACAAGRATIVVRHRSGETHRREVDLAAEPAQARTRLLALVLAEAVEAGDASRRPTRLRRRASRAATPGVGRELPLPPSAPPRADLAGLRILEQEAGRYGDRSSGYLATVVAIARREYERRLQSVLSEHDRLIVVESARLAAARRRAITDYAAFVVSHADDALATSGARLRLAELTHEELHAPAEEE